MRETKTHQVIFSQGMLVACWAILPEMCMDETVSPAMDLLVTDPPFGAIGDGTNL